VWHTTEIVPRDTDDRIRRLCAEVLEAKTDAEKERSLRQLREALREHIVLAGTSLKLQVETLTLLEAVARISSAKAA
jgi:hypothetical protein